MDVTLQQLYWFVKEYYEFQIGIKTVVYSATNSSPIKVTTLNPTNYANGTQVTIEGASGNTAANGTSYVFSIGPSEFELYEELSNVTNASNTSPIVATIPNNNFTTGENIEITGVNGNTAANGSFFVVQQGVVITAITGSAIKVITGLTDNIPPIVTVTSHGYSTGNRVQIVGSAGTNTINGVFYINVIDINNFSLYTDVALTQPVDASTIGAYTGGSTTQLYVPIIVTAAGHEFATRNNVKIIDVVGQLAALGAFYINVIDINTFSLYADSNLTIPILSSGIYISGGIAALLSNNNMLLYLDSALTIPSIGNGNYTNGGLIFTGPVAGNGTYVGGGFIAKEVDVYSYFSTIFPGIPENIYDSYVKRIKLGFQPAMVQVFVVSNASQTSPIVITSAGTASFINGAQVNITGVNGNTAANGNYYVGNLMQSAGTFTFSLYQDPALTVPVASNGAYVSRGIVRVI